MYTPTGNLEHDAATSHGARYSDDPTHGSRLLRDFFEIARLVRSRTTLDVVVALSFDGQDVVLQASFHKIPELAELDMPAARFSFYDPALALDFDAALDAFIDGTLERAQAELAKRRGLVRDQHRVLAAERGEIDTSNTKSIGKN